MADKKGDDGLPSMSYEWEQDIVRHGICKLINPSQYRQLRDLMQIC